ncbi:MAG TPA: hypothetical protein PK511_11895 [Chitinophagales bacterium]|nr:hypothetical protein [Chitinophagales bacterium]HMU68567.1 hypothetical protein [Chitinophagales bacterium]HMX05243.1 hypothetical protein [Chitinophagales bacterium]HNA58607.1 hypothetical protein [Chitinophagales bacterium]HNE46587.1 hypothetical protein [Chitinophagales bacterium]
MKIELFSSPDYFHTMSATESNTISSKMWFWSHFALVVIAWIGPFIFDWYLMVTGYALVVIQFAVFNRCLMNDKHDLAEEGDMTFYAQLLESIGFNFSRAKVKRIVRPWIYVFLAVFVIFLQVIFRYVPVLHIPG